VAALVVWLAAALLLALALVGWFDLRQTRHAILRNYPIIGHLRFLFESSGPRCQYFIEATPRALPSPRPALAGLPAQAGPARQPPLRHPAGRQRQGYEWVNHSLQPHAGLARLPHLDRRRPRPATEGVAPCTQPYHASVFNISAMSFGALSANAILALNQGARWAASSTTPAKARSASTTACMAAI
jgi:hypothetical protein